MKRTTRAASLEERQDLMEAFLVGVILLMGDTEEQRRLVASLATGKDPLPYRACHCYLCEAARGLVAGA